MADFITRVDGTRAALCHNLAIPQTGWTFRTPQGPGPRRLRLADDAFALFPG